MMFITLFISYFQVAQQAGRSMHKSTLSNNDNFCSFVIEYHWCIYLLLRGYCTPGQFLDCFCIFLKNYNTLVTSKICFF